MDRPGRYILTPIVKGTFELCQDAVAEPAVTQLFPTGDEPYADDAESTGSPRYSSDFARYKPRADLLVVGTCHPPGGPVPSCTVGFQVGQRGKTLRVWGNRSWVQAAGV